MKRILLVLLALFLVTGCDVVKQRMGVQDPAKLEAEGKAVGSACRHAGRGLEDCYKLNPRSPKAAVFAGWKDMNEYMLKNSMEAMPPTLSPDTHPAPAKVAESPAAAEPQKMPAEKPAAEVKKEAGGH